MRSQELLLQKEARHHLAAAFSLYAGWIPSSPLSSSRCCKLISNNLLLNLEVAAKSSPNKLPEYQQEIRLVLVCWRQKRERGNPSKSWLRKGHVQWVVRKLYLKFNIKCSSACATDGIWESFHTQDEPITPAIRNRHIDAFNEEKKNNNSRASKVNVLKNISLAAHYIYIT